MAITRSMTRNQNRFEAPWSCLNHDVLFLIMMRIGVVDFVAFSGVCKSWRSLALSNKSRFMASKPPMKIWITGQRNEKEYHLQDYEGSSKKMLLPESGGRTCVGITCGYLVLFGQRTRDFLLLNPITRHRLDFPDVPKGDHNPHLGVRAMLVFSSSMSVWVFVFSFSFSNTIWFSIVGKGEWKFVSLGFKLFRLTDFKGKIYVIDFDFIIYEVELDLEPKLTLLKFKNFPFFWLRIMLVCLDEKLFAIEQKDDGYMVLVLDFGEMKWEKPEEKTIQENAFFYSNLVGNTAVIKTGLCSDSWWRDKRDGLICLPRYTHVLF